MFSLQDFQVGNITLNYYYYYTITPGIEIDIPTTHTPTTDRHERKFERLQPCLCIPNNDVPDRKHISWYSDPLLRYAQDEKKMRTSKTSKEG